MATGVFGVIGAAIGGLAAAWGTRTGAERAALAAQRQVRDQAVAEHLHWLRQQRLEAYEGFMRAYDSFARVATNSLLAAERRSESGQSRRIPLSADLPSGSEVAAMGEQVRVMEERSARISVLGPPPVEECAVALTRAAGLETQRYEVERKQRSDEPPQQVGEMEVQAQVEHRKRFLAASRQALGIEPDGL